MFFGRMCIYVASWVAAHACLYMYMNVLHTETGLLLRMPLPVLLLFAHGGRRIAENRVSTTIDPRHATLQQGIFHTIRYASRLH